MLVLGLDFETTGLDANIDEIIEVGAVLWETDANRPIKFLSVLVKSKKPIPAEITELTGIADADLERWGISEHDALKQLVDLGKDAEYVVAHNGNSFDRLFLEKALRRNSELKLDRPWIDTTSDLPFPAGLVTRKLSYLAAEHGFLNPFSHRAVFDVLTMLKVLSHYKFEEVVALHESPLRRVIAGVSFDEREKAKNLGFRWDPSHKQWFIEIKECQLKARQFPFPIQVS